ncbi:MAG: polysaccharide deacetylase [Lachnospiraceae bacterium]|nr:polysaccharide deacetylase [Lachnospiraceae bacterium]
MSDNRIVGLKEKERRRRRVNRLKKTIIGVISFWMLFSLTAIIILTVSLCSSNRRMKKVEETINSSGDAVVEDENKGNEGGDIEDFEGDDQGEDNTELIVPDDPEPEDPNDNVDPNAKKVYLTFDDGPSHNTELILDILKEYNVKATFFVIGRNDEYSKSLYKRIVDEGHTIALHSYTHRYSSIYASLDAYKEDLQKISDLVYDATGVRSKFIRFPGGSSNKVSHVSMRDIIKYVVGEGYTYFDWNVINGDATGKAYTVDELVQNVFNDCGKYDTNVVLMHDAEAKTSTVEALPKILDKLIEDGYLILPIDENTTPIQHIKASSVVNN